MSDRANWLALWLFLAIFTIGNVWSQVEVMDRLMRIERLLEQPVPPR